MLPGSRSPRVREPMTKSCVPSRDGRDELVHERGHVAAVAVEEEEDVAPGSTAATPAAHARP